MLLNFGKNLKKIRSIHGMSQQDFADIFALKRGTLGAYEEGRSNPKLETVLKIANHFSIGLEELLISELTVNKLLKFNERLTIENNTYLAADFKPIPCVLVVDKNDFIKGFLNGFDLNQVSSIKLPYVDCEDRLAFSVDDLSMTGGTVEFFPKDIVVGVKLDPVAIDDKSLVVVLTQSELLLRRLYKENSSFILKADHHGVEEIRLPKEKLLAIWKIEHVFHHAIHTKEILLEKRLATIEQNIASLKIKKTEKD